jgi:tryptophan halogenase
MKQSTNSKLVIVGGGSAGWMTASALIKSFPEKEIILIESPNVPTIGVGESTTQYMREWVDFLGLKDEEWMPACDATYKFGLKFVDFAEKDFYYPFGYRCGDVCTLTEYFLYSNNNHTDHADFGRVFYNQQAGMEQNRIPHDYIKQESGFHFDANKFALYLRNNYAVPMGVKHIQDDVVNVNVDDAGITDLQLKNLGIITGDLYFDCTGFKGLLTQQALNTPWIDFSDKLFNNRTWAARIPYANKKEELKPYTTCTAMKHGWIWEVPTWSRLGTGYNYSDKFVSPEEALAEFKQYIGHREEDIVFRDLRWPTGVREKVWNKNVVAIGLSGGFIEPLESGGLYSVHEFLNAFLDVVEGHNRWDGLARDSFNWKCRDIFTQFADFVELHYTMSRRCDTKYWQTYTSKENTLENNNLLKQLFEYQHHTPFNLSYPNDMWFGLSMLVGGYKYPIKNNRKQSYFLGRHSDAVFPEDISNRIREKIYSTQQPQTQWSESLKYYESTIYKNY